jgi:hypothetical protein
MEIIDKIIEEVFNHGLSKDEVADTIKYLQTKYNTEIKNLRIQNKNILILITSKSSHAGDYIRLGVASVTHKPTRLTTVSKADGKVSAETKIANKYIIDLTISADGVARFENSKEERSIIFDKDTQRIVCNTTLCAINDSELHELYEQLKTGLEGYTFDRNKCEPMKKK